jgi:hypothetical protein
MKSLAWVVVALGLVQGGWLAFDGSRALIVGDYVTPSFGQYAGQLGPWAKLVSAIGIEPRSKLMKSVHLGLGALWIVMTIGFIWRMPWAWPGLLACAVLTLWYLPFGTLISVIEIILLLMPPVRGQNLRHDE